MQSLGLRRAESAVSTAFGADELDGGHGTEEES